MIIVWSGCIQPYKTRSTHFQALKRTCLFQAERRAVLNAAELANLNVLQLITEPMATALNYGMFRRKEINGTVKYMMFYEMGAHDTTATVVSYQIIKTKERGFSETHPQAQILGVG